MNVISNDLNEKRDYFFDTLRGIAIISVVAIHASGYIFPSDKIHLNDFGVTISLFYRQILNFAVPIFLFISGYWVSNKKINSLIDYKQFLNHRLSKVVIPYLFWSIVILSLAAVKTHIFNIPHILLNLVTGGASAPYYFIILIVQFYLLTPILKWINLNRYGFIFILFINLLGLLISYISRLYLGAFYSSLLVYALPFYTWIIFYELGILYRNNENYEISENKAVLVATLIVLTLSLSFFEAKFILIRFGNLDLATSAVKVSSFLYSGCIIAGFIYLRQKMKKWPNLLISIGNYSFGIYLIHISVLSLVHQFLNIDLVEQPIFQIMYVFMTLTICYVFIFTSKRMLPRAISNKLLGF